MSTTLTMTDENSRAELSSLKLQFVFTSEAAEKGREVVLKLLKAATLKYPGPASEEEARKSFSGEEFYLLMPTRAAFECEVRLCEAISQYSQKKISESALYIQWQEFLDTHTFIYLTDKRDVRRGDLGDWYQDTLLLVTTAEDAFVCNPIQLFLYALLHPSESGKYAFLD